MKLSVFKNNHLVKELEFKSGQQGSMEGPSVEYLIGRSQECHIVLDDQKVSRRHALLKSESGNWEISSASDFGDLLVNGSPKGEHLIQNGDGIGVGPFVLVFSLDEAKKVKNTEKVVNQNIVESNESNIVEDEISSDKVQEQTIDLELEDSKDKVEAQEKSDVFSSTEDTAEDESVSSELQEERSSEESSENLSFDNTVEQSEDNAVIDTFGETGGDIVSASDDENEGTQFLTNFAQFELTLEGPHAPYDRYSIKERETVIGRDPQKAQIILNDGEVSSTHSVLIKTNISCSIKDLGSSNGTLLNGEKINEATLNHGDVFQIGSTKFTFNIKSELLELESDRLMPVEEYQELEKEVDPALAGSSMGESTAFSSDADEAIKNEKSIIKKLIYKWKKLPPKKQLIYGAIGVLLLLVLLPGEDPKNAKNSKTDKGKSKESKDNPNLLTQKKDEIPTGDNLVKQGKVLRKLSPEEVQFVEASYQLGKELFSQGKYSETIFELQKVFNITEDYKQTKQLYDWAKEGLAKIEELEKKKQAEIDRKIRLEKVKEIYEKAKEAVKERNVLVSESLFAQILELDPENLDVPQLKIELEAWKKEQDRIAEEKARKEAERKRQVNLLTPGKTLFLKKDWYSATVKLEEFLNKENLDEDLIKEATDMLSEAKKMLASQLDPMLGKARSLKEGQDLKGAYESYSDVLKLEPSNIEALNEVSTIKETLEIRSKKVYREALIDESLSLFDDAKQKLQEVQQISPTDSEYYIKATEKLKNYLE